jgi:regulator of nucleoside diphosphate kinase
MQEAPMLSKLAEAMRQWSKHDPPAISSVPQITLGDMEHRQLNVLAMTGLSHNAAASDRLYWELDRARVVPEGQIGPGVVRMGSIVTYRTDDGLQRTVRLVYPEDATDGDRVSILSPLGTALIGVSTGDTVPWSQDDRHGTVRVLSVCGP